MKVIGKDIGEALDAMYSELESRVRVEAERELRVEPFDGGSFSNVSWEQPGLVVISLHNGVPTHALPHVFGVALQHVRQRLDLYPVVRPGERNVDGAALVRTALRELVLAPEAEQHLEPLNLDVEWETEQRHEGLKQLLRDAPEEWDQPGTVGNAFASLQYARFTIEHPPHLWESLREQFRERLPVAAEHGEGVVQVVRSHGWNSPGACVTSLISARDELSLGPFAVVEDRRNGRRY